MTESSQPSPTKTSPRLHLFEAFGVEIEYMIADHSELNVSPIADRLIEAECGTIQDEIFVDDLAWSNELALHVIELKTPTPATSLDGLSRKFQSHVGRINNHLSKINATLLPSAMHPWMNPATEMRLWPHNYSDVYAAFDRIFDCTGHGWANLQSVHLNLPFCGDEEFGRLHAAVRLVLPLLPGLAASSPLIDGRLSGMMDTRLDVYRSNARRVPLVSGNVIPEQAFTEADYHRIIFEPMFQQIAPLDSDGILQDEFLNARGAIARFGRGSIEIRVIDVQECPAADLAILQLTVAVLRALTNEKWSNVDLQQDMGVQPLQTILLDAIRDGEEAVIRDKAYLQLFGLSRPVCTIRELWQYLADSTVPETDATTAPALELILNEGPLSRRIVKRLAGDVSHASTKRIYNDLAECLSNGQSFPLR